MQKSRGRREKIQISSATISSAVKTRNAGALRYIAAIADMSATAKNMYANIFLPSRISISGVLARSCGLLRASTLGWWGAYSLSASSGVAEPSLPHPFTRQSRLTPNISHRRCSLSSSGTAVPVSLFETDWRETPASPASSSCESCFSLLSRYIF